MSVRVVYGERAASDLGADMWFWLLTTGVCIWWAIEETETGNRTFLILLGCLTATMGAVRAYQLWREEREARRGP
jgi:heme/copper-type cytochrome/quinol oxidase subunit 3